MARTYIFAIGGTGARVVRSLTMLMASGIPGFNHDTEICPIIIDYDLHNGDKDRAVTSMKKYCKVRELIEKGEHDPNNGFFGAKITDTVKGFQWYFDIQNNADRSYSDYIGYSNMDTESPTTKKLVESLYDSSNDEQYTELNINMKVGFQGNPNIGSVVFNRLRGDEEFKNFATFFKPDKDKVVIIGSLFGGTGASGIPQLITAMHNEHAPSNLKRANVAAVMVLPYFDVKKNNNVDSINSILFNSKTKAALNYYETSKINDAINSIYYVGDRTATVVEYSLGDFKQKNNAHPVEMIAAMAVAHFVTKVKNDDKDYRNVQQHRYKFNVGGEIGDDGLTFKSFVGVGTIKSTVGGVDPDPFVKDVMHQMINFNLMMRYFDEKVYTNEVSSLASWYKDNRLKLNVITDKTTLSDDGNNHLKDFLAELYRFYCHKDLGDNKENDDGYFQWINELQNDKHKEHRLHFFNFESKEIARFIPECQFVIERSGIGIGRYRIGQKSTPILTYDTSYNSCLDTQVLKLKYWNDRPGDTESDDKLPWVLIDSMYEASEALRTFGDLNEKFEQLP